MAELLKNLYSDSFFVTFGNHLQKFDANFPYTQLISTIQSRDWENLELKQRMRRISESLFNFLPQDFKKSSVWIADFSKFVQESDNSELNFQYMFLPDFVEIYGINHINESLEALEQITKFTSGEFAIRPFIEQYPEPTLARMLEWSRHENPWVRRLASEGSRPRLPWGMGLKQLQKNPTPILPILENLKTDPHESVRRSVANSLNDIAKDNPDVVISILEKWKNIHPHTDWILKHGSRTLLKKANAEALAYFGFEENLSVEIKNLSLKQKEIAIGEDLNFSFMLINKNADKKLRIEYGIDYVKSNGKKSRKIFQISEKIFDNLSKFEKKQSFRDMTTRKHYPGQHSLAILVNGKEMSKIDFVLTEK